MVQQFTSRNQNVCADALRWLPGEFAVKGDTLHVAGWALPNGAPHSECQFLLNGNVLNTASWPIPSPDLQKHFNMLGNADRSGFRIEHTLDKKDFVNGVLRLDFCRRGLNSFSYRHAWFLVDPSRERAMPEDNRITRVIGSPNSESYKMGGATLKYRIDLYLQQRFGRSLDKADRILDWGCGSGRLTRYLLDSSRSVVGVDIDADNVKWCKDNLGGGRFEPVPLRPRTQLESGAFDVIIGCSVFTHLEEGVQFEWLEELSRITKKGGLVLVSVLGPSQMALYRLPEDQCELIEKMGFVDQKSNPQLDGYVDDEYYRDVAQSRDYIFQKWGQYFNIIEIVDAIAAGQDLVVMEKR